jgi:type II secretory pathway pseudopilin PulG
MIQAPRRSAARLAGGFTLVELVTTVALMSVMMLGVVEIFRVITTTTAEAEAAANAQQQMRGLFDQLHRDIRGMTRDGYLRVDARMTQPQQMGGLWQVSDPVDAASITDKTRAYAVNTLGFVSLGQWSGIFPTQVRGDAAEVVYTNYTKTPTQYLTLGTRTTKEDARRGIISRGTWLMDGTAGTGNDADDRSAAAFLGQTLAGDQPRRTDASVTVDPWVPGLTYPTSFDTLRRVMVTGASEFCVEYLEETWSSNRWEGTWRNATTTWTSDSPVWPRAIRVTAVVHDPTEKGPAEDILDSGGAVVGKKRHQGYALQEVFWVGDP